MTAPESRAADLLPCPSIICGMNEARIWDCIAGFSVKCAECGASTHDYPTPELAIAEWNTRPTLTTSAAAEAAMREALTKMMRYDGLEGSESYHASKFYDARAKAKALATPASALAERMMRVIEAARAWWKEEWGEASAAAINESRRRGDLSRSKLTRLN